MTEKVVLERFETGVPGLDTLLQGGISKYSFVVITGAPGCGKTTLAHQMMFSLANEQRKALYFTIVGEPPLKMLRYQQQYSFFDIAKVGPEIRYLNLAEDLQQGGFDGVLHRIQEEVEQFQPELIFVDSFKSVVNAARPGEQGIADLQFFVQRLGMQMASWQATTFLIGEYANADQESNPIFTVADGVIHLKQDCDQNAVVRKIRVVKMRGTRHMSGLHSFRISEHGLTVFPRLLNGGIVQPQLLPSDNTPKRRLSTGCIELDGMLYGGLPAGYSMLVLGPPGSGKTVLAASFLNEGAKNGEPGVLASFEHIVSTAISPTMSHLIESGQVAVVQPKQLDLSIEEIVTELVEAVERTQAKRLVIDSLTALELALAPQFRENFEEALFRMLATFAKRDVTVWMIKSLENTADTYLAPSGFLVDAILSLRCVEIDFELVKLIASVKLRGSPHSQQIRPYTVHEDGFRIGEALDKHTL